MEKKRGTEYNTAIKLQDRQVEQIMKLIEEKNLKYRSRSDFVTKAVENEIKLATIKKDLSTSGKAHFDTTYNTKLLEAIREAIVFDRNIPGTKLYKQHKKFERQASKKLKL